MYKITITKWERNSDIRKNERINVGKVYDGKKAVGDAVMKCFVYFSRIKRGYERIFVVKRGIQRTISFKI